MNSAQCPKCGLPRAAGVSECAKCGIVFSRYEESSTRSAQQREIRQLELDRLVGNTTRLNVVQEAREWTEIILDWEIANTYSVRDSIHRERAMIVEQGSTTRDALRRNILGSRRPLTMAVVSPDGQSVILRLDRPFSWFLSEMRIATDEGRTIGRVVRRWSLFRRVYELHDAQQLVFARIESPMWKIWTFPVYDREGRPCAEISKKWTGLTQEMVTDADTFRVQFNPELWDAEQRAVVLCAAVLIDFDFFENKGSRRS